MSIAVVRLLIDFGLVVLIWIIQLIVYPSFLHYTTNNLIKWHSKYTPLIGFIVGPLMLAQLGISIYQLHNEITTYNVINVMLISVIWILTFLQFVPIHNNISRGKISKSLLVSLVLKNWSRTILWTLLFMYNIFTTFS